MSISNSIKALNIRQWFSEPELDEQSNEALMLRYARDQESAVLIALYDNCSADLYHFLLTLSSPSMAEEVSAIVWLKVIEKRRLYSDSGSFKNWLFTISRRCLIDEFRMQGRLVQLDDNHVADILTHTDCYIDDASKLEQKGEFEHALRALPFEQKEAFCLQQEGFSIDDIARIASSNKETIKSRLRYAKETLRKKLTASHSGHSQ